MDNTETIVGDQEKNTPAENIVSFNISGEKVIATFTSKETLNEYIIEYSAMSNTKRWYDRVGFANFKKDGNTIIGSSSYHSVWTIMLFIKNGLQNL